MPEAEATQSGGEAERLFAEALGLHQTGRLVEAETIYRRLLARAPNDPNLLQLLGTIAGQTNRPGEAVVLLRQAIALDPRVAASHQNLGAAYEALGRNAEAAEAYNTLGNLWQFQGEFAASVTAYERALTLAPDHFASRNNRGAALTRLGRFEEAAETLRSARALDPSSAEAVNNLGNALLGLNRSEEAIGAYREALALRPDYPEAFNNLGLAYQQIDEPEAAVEVIGQALALQPDYPEALVNLGNALRGPGKPPDEAVESYRKAIALRPEFALAHWNLALALLESGDFAEGWQEYEWRWRWSEFPDRPRPFAEPAWQGEAPEEIRGPLLVTAEQGFGDTLQFCRYVPLLAALGHRVIFEVHRPLLTLLWSSFAGFDNLVVVPRTDNPALVEGAPGFARHVSLLSLPLRFGTELATIPAETPYLAGDPVRAARWREKLAGNFRIGVAWAGSPGHRLDRERSLDLDMLRGLSDLPGVALYSLQKDAAEQATRHAGFPITALGSYLFDFAETAAVIAGLDLVVAVDTAVAHLAAALGKPVSILLPAVADWRWLESRLDSPWYPTARLYRQGPDRDWAPVIKGLISDVASAMKP